MRATPFGEVEVRKFVNCGYEEQQAKRAALSVSAPMQTFRVLQSWLGAATAMNLSQNKNAVVRSSAYLCTTLECLSFPAFWGDWVKDWTEFVAVRGQDTLT